MASGHARREFERTGKRVKIVDVHGRQRWHVLWQGLNWIAKPHERGYFVTIKNAAQGRPYIVYPFTRESGQRWTDWRARDHLGAIALTHFEKAFANQHTRRLGDFVVIEPGMKAKASPNKQWGAERWRELAALLLGAGVRVVQVGPERAPIMAGVDFIVTRTFREAAAILTQARAAVLPEGGLHHAAAVLGIHAVVLFGGFISPTTTGYPGHVNLADDGEGSPCGRWLPCPHCEAVWSRITPEQVSKELLGILHSDYLKDAP